MRVFEIDSTFFSMMFLSLKRMLATYCLISLLMLFVSVQEAEGGTAIGEIMPLGDSITEGYAGTGGGYRDRLYFLLSNAADLFNFVGVLTNNSSGTLSANGQDHHEGHSGYRIDQLKGNLTGLVSAAPAEDSNYAGHWFDGGNGTGREAVFPDMILLHIGTNDASQGRSAAQMQTELQGLLTEIKNNRPNAQVIVASLILRTDSSNFESVQMTYNNAIPGIVAAQGANFHFLDMHAVLGPGDLADGVHPTQAGYDKMAAAWSNGLHAVAKVEPLNLVTAVSRKPHGSAGNFDISLPLSGTPGIECRTKSPAGGDTVVLTLTNKVTSANARVTAGRGSVTGSPVFAGNVMTVNLTGVTDAQQITVTLSSVTDTYSHVLPSVAVKMNVLSGDTTGNKIVNASDVSQTKSQSGRGVSGSNFRADVTADGTVNGSDISVVKSHSGIAIP
jgi:lysophospholipase L1-like esterase